jgi:hypothetical protein
MARVTDECIIELLKRQFTIDPDKWFSVADIIKLLSEDGFEINRRTIYGKIDKLLLFNNIAVKMGNTPGTWYDRREFKFNNI